MVDLTLYCCHFPHVNKCKGCKRWDKVSTAGEIRSDRRYQCSLADPLKASFINQKCDYLKSLCDLLINQSNDPSHYFSCIDTGNIHMCDGCCKWKGKVDSFGSRKRHSSLGEVRRDRSLFALKYQCDYNMKVFFDNRVRNISGIFDYVKDTIEANKLSFDIQLLSQLMNTVSQLKKPQDSSMRSIYERNKVKGGFIFILYLFYFLYCCVFNSFVLSKRF